VCQAFERQTATAALEVRKKSGAMAAVDTATEGQYVLFTSGGYKLLLVVPSQPFRTNLRTFKQKEKMQLLSINGRMECVVAKMGAFGKTGCGCIIKVQN
jgi:uncharacterized radical SAM superfamily protein